MWSHRHFCIKNLPLPDDCIYEMKQYLDIRHPCYQIKNKLINELVDICNYMNKIIHHDDRVFIFVDENELIFQSLFCMDCGNYLMFNEGIMEGNMMCKCKKNV